MTFVSRAKRALGVPRKLLLLFFDPESTNGGRDVYYGLGTVLLIVLIILLLIWLL
jgi:hypothetical protein